MSAFDDLHEALLKAKALSYMTYGNAGESFRSMGDEVQDEFLWALSDLLVEAVGALECLRAEDHRGTEKGGNG